MQEAQERLNTHHLRITEGLALQARVDYYEQGEKNNSYFLNLIKTNQQKTTIRKLKNENVEVETQAEIMKMLKDFYMNLFSKKIDKYDPSWIEELKSQNLIPQLDARDKEMLEKEITIEELSKTLKTFGNNKAPGNDGLTYEFYKRFWPKIGPFLLKSLDESLKNGKMSTSQRQAIIRLLEKKGKCRLNIKNWRPLMLLNDDVKLVSKRKEWYLSFQNSLA